MTTADPRDTPAGATSGDDVPPPPGDDPVEHLWSAAHEMLRAFRTLIDAADEFVESQRGGRSETHRDEAREGRVHHIDIDVREPDEDAFVGDRPDAGAAPVREAGTGTV